MGLNSVTMHQNLRTSPKTKASRGSNNRYVTVFEGLICVLAQGYEVLKILPGSEVGGEQSQTKICPRAKIGCVISDYYALVILRFRYVNSIY